MKTKHANPKSSEERIDMLWEESKAEHRKDVAERLYKYGGNVRKWQILMLILYLICPKFYLKLYKKRIKVRRKAYCVLLSYMPLIKDQIRLKSKFFNIYEEENSAPNLCASFVAMSGENDANDAIEKLVIKMTLELIKIPEYNKWFYSIQDPRELIENPYPGYIDTRRACNYCDHLLQSFR